MEFIGKGGYGKGALWVALRLPEGHVMAHANQARITTFLPCDDEDTCRMAPDVVSFAIKRGYWKGGATDPAFSFSGTYDPVTFEGARFCEVLTPHPFACCTPQPHAAPPLHAAPLSMMHLIAC